jgi:saccharopine dehydrogenase-like NADP-dependent oxidoreductase
MKHIVLFGAGKSATVLIDYLKQLSAEKKWQVTIADGNLDAVHMKVGQHPYCKAAQVNITNDEQRRALITDADVVISLMPPNLHFPVAKDCANMGKHLLTASYVDDQIRQLQQEVNEKGVLFLCEMGLDPGIDHMSAMKIIHDIKNKGGHISSFKSHCGGLVAPESDDNPWHYKISWNPRNVVMAGKAGAIYKEHGEIKEIAYEEMFNACPPIETDGLKLAYYPNRDSLSYISLYELEEADTFIRTTLRYPEFCFGWKNIIDLKLTDETPAYQTDGMSLQQFFQQHMAEHGFSDWVTKHISARFDRSKMMMESLMKLIAAEENATEEEKREMAELMLVDDQGSLMDINLDALKSNAASFVATEMHDANLALKQLLFLGMNDEETIINKGLCSAADVLQFALENKLVLKPADKDMIVMLHEFDYTVNGSQFTVNSSLMVKGEDSLRTAMAKTVGLPLGIAAKLILDGVIKTTGLHIPTLPEIYEPVLKELELHGVKFNEQVIEQN